MEQIKSSPGSDASDQSLREENEALTARIAQLEAECEESEGKLELVLGASRDAIWDCDLESGVVTWNESYDEILGGRPADSSQSWDWWEKRLHPEDAERVMRSIKAALAGDAKHWIEEYRFQGPDKEYLYIQDRANIVRDEAGKARRIMGAMRDVSESRRLEERFQVAVSGASVALWDSNLITGKVWYHSGWQALLGYSPEEIEDTNETINSWVHDEDRDFMWEQVRKHIEEGVPLDFECRLRHRNGSYRWVRASGKAEFNAAGEPIRLSGASRDITERKLSEQRFAHLLERSPVAMFVARAGEIYLVNQAFQELFGYSAEDLKTMECWWKVAVADEADRDAISKSWAEQTTCGTEEPLPPLELEVVCSDGGVRQIQMHEASISGDRLIVLVDLTALCEAEAAQRQSDARFQVLVESAPEAIILLEAAEQKNILVNENARQMFGYSEEEFLTLNPIQLAPEKQPDGRDSIEVATPYFERAMAGETVAYEFVNQGRDGNLIPCDVKLVRIPSQEGCLIRVSVTDITERKKAEEDLQASQQLFEQLTEAINEIVWLRDAETLEVLFVSNATQRVFGVAKESMSQDPFSFLEYAHPEDRDRVQETMRELGRTGYQIEYRLLLPDGDLRWVRTRAYPLHDAEGKVIRIAGITEDVTEQHRLTQSLERASEFEKAAMGNDIHDTLCQELPVAGMLCKRLASRLEESDPDASRMATQIATLIVGSAKKARKLANGISPLLHDHENLRGALVEMLEVEGANFPQVRCNLEFKTQTAGLDTFAAMQLYYIIREASLNALKHGSPSRVDIVLWREDNYLCISITDDGCGRASELNQNSGGLGLGSMRYRASLLNGTLKIRNNPNQEYSGLQVLCRTPLSSPTTNENHHGN